MRTKVLLTRKPSESKMTLEVHVEISVIIIVFAKFNDKICLNMRMSINRELKIENEYRL